MLLNAAHCILHAGLHRMIVCYHQLEQYIVFSAMFFDFVRLEFFSTVYPQVANLSASKGHKLFQKRKWRRTSFSRKGHKILGTFICDQQEIPIRSGRQPRLQASPQSVCKSVPGCEKGGVEVLALVVAPSSMPGSAGSFAMSHIFRI